METYYNLISRQIKVDINLTDLTPKTQLALLEALMEQLGISQKMKPETLEEIREIVGTLGIGPF